MIDLFFNNFNSSFYCCSSTVVSIFYPHHLPPVAPPIPASHPQTYALWFCPCVLYTCSLVALPLYSTTILLSPPLWLLSVCSLFQCLSSTLLACLFVDWVPLIGEIVWYLSFTSWLISFSIMLSSSTHAVVKGRNFFFLSVA